MRVKPITGRGITSKVGTELTDLGIARYDPQRDAIAVMFGDSFSYSWGQDWRSPVIIMYDDDLNVLGRATKTGIDSEGMAPQLWRYGHNNPDYSTILPCDFIRIKGRWYVAVMVTAGLGNEKVTEFWESDDLVDWHPTDPFIQLHHPGHPGNTMLTFDHVGEWVYIFGTGGLARNKPIWLWRCRASEFPQGLWEPWGKLHNDWEWGNPNERSPIISGRYGEICYRYIQGNHVLSGFDAAHYRQIAYCLDTVNGNWLQDATYVQYVGGHELPQLYGGYIVPGSRLNEQNGMRFLVSQWITRDNSSYQVIQYNDTLPAKGAILPESPMLEPELEQETPTMTSLDVSVLSQAMGNSAGVDYATLLPYVEEALVRSNCTNLNRSAMWFAQIGHESAGLRYMEEIADGSAYEGRTDLGNTQPGDGRRFKGRGPIQITGRHNYGVLSEWAYGQGYVDSPTKFVDQPTLLSDPTYGFLGAVWYWTVARPQINSMCDVGDLIGVTRAINGGTHGLDDRRQRWDNALRMGGRIVVTGVVAPSAALKGEVVIPFDLSKVPQETGYWCGPASAQTVLQGLGIYVDEETLARECKTHTGGTDYVALIERCLDARLPPEKQYASVDMIHDPPTAAEKEELWKNIVRSIDGGCGIVMNWVVPANNRPRSIKGSQTLAYGNTTTYHYVACMGYDDNPSQRAVYIADSGFRPFNAWITFDQCATLIPPKAYAFGDVQPSVAPPVVTPAVTPQPVIEGFEGWTGVAVSEAEQLKDIWWKHRAPHRLAPDRPRHPAKADDLLGHLLSMRAEILFTQALTATIATKLGIDIEAIYDQLQESLQ